MEYLRKKQQIWLQETSSAAGASTLKGSTCRTQKLLNLSALNDTLSDIICIYIYIHCTYMYIMYILRLYYKNIYIYIECILKIVFLHQQNSRR